MLKTLPLLLLVATGITDSAAYPNIPEGICFSDDKHSNDYVPPGCPICYMVNPSGTKLRLPAVITPSIAAMINEAAKRNLLGVECKFST